MFMSLNDIRVYAHETLNNEQLSGRFLTVMKSMLKLELTVEEMDNFLKAVKPHINELEPEMVDDIEAVHGYLSEVLDSIFFEVRKIMRFMPAWKTMRFLKRV